MLRIKQALMMILFVASCVIAFPAILVALVLMGYAEKER